MGRRDATVDELVAGVQERDTRAIARSISLVENREPDGGEVVRLLYPHTGGAATVGVTGPPGVGKSSLVGALVRHVRSEGRTAAVLSVDPSSPFTHGALLGDRIRLTDHFLDPGVYIRSMGTRGHHGGLAEAALQALLVLDAAGFDVLFVETVGAGQGEVDVIGVADVVLLVLMPGSGDSVQALKAGIMEIPDTIAVNKRDHPAADAMVKEVRSIVTLEPDASRRPAVLLTEALRGEGVPELWAELERCRATLAESGALEQRRRRNLAAGVLDLATARVKERIERAVGGRPELAALVGQVGERQVDPVTAADEIVAALIGGDGGTADAR